MTALYLDVKKDLLDKITSGEYSEGTIIPTEHELSDLYNVSRPTIRKAVQILVDAGYLEKKRNVVRLYVHLKSFKILPNQYQALIHR